MVRALEDSQRFTATKLTSHQEKVIFKMVGKFCSNFITVAPPPVRWQLGLELSAQFLSPAQKKNKKKTTTSEGAENIVFFKLLCASVLTCLGNI